MASNSEKFGLCIIGAGIFGSAAAKYASAYENAKVCLVGPEEPTMEELKHRLILGSHYDEGRIIAYSGVNTLYATLVKKSIQTFKLLETRTNMQLFCPTEGLFIYNEKHPNVSLHLNDINTGNSDMLNLSSHEKFSERFPFLKLKENECAFLNSNSGFVSPRQLIKAQKRIAKEQGCVIKNDIVENIENDSDGIFKISTASNDSIKAEKILICAGAFTNFLSYFDERKLNYDINKESYILIRISADEANRLKTMPTIDLFYEPNQDQPNLHGAYILPPIQYPDGNHYIKVGHLGSLIDPQLNTLDEIHKWLLSKGEHYIEDFYTNLLKELISDLKIEEIIGKTCVTCSNPCGYPYIDCIAPNITVATVGNGSGVSQCEEVSRLATCLSRKGIWDSELPMSTFKALFK